MILSALFLSAEVSILVALLIIVLILVALLVVVLVLIVILAAITVLILITVLVLILIVIHNNSSEYIILRQCATVDFPNYQVLFFGLNRKLIIKPPRIAAVIPPAVALRPPVRIPRNPSSLIASFTPFARE